MINKKKRTALWLAGILLLVVALILDRLRAEPKVTIPLIIMIALAAFHTFRPRREE